MLFKKQSSVYDNSDFSFAFSENFASLICNYIRKILWGIVTQNSFVLHIFNILVNLLLKERLVVCLLGFLLIRHLMSCFPCYRSQG